MAGNGGAERPRCACHGEPCDKSGRGGFYCAVRRRARQRARYRADPATANYARARKALRARIERKRRQIEELEERLAEEDARRDGEGQDHEGHADSDPSEALVGG